MTTEKVKGNIALPELIFWRWTPNKAGKCPVKLRVTYGGKRRYYFVNHRGQRLFLSMTDGAVVDNPKYKPRDKALNDIRKTLTSFKSEAQNAINRATRGNHPFTWDKFESEFLLQESGGGFLSIFTDHLETIRSENRIGTYKAYNNALQAFKKFRKDKELSPFDVTPKLLKDFEAFLVKKGCGKTTIGMYTRSLRVVYNLAADQNPELLKSYPFARRQNQGNRYKIRTGSGHKGDALTLEQLRRLIAVEIANETPEHEAKQLWLFSFYCQGMNMKDIALLRYKDIQGQHIYYVRAKTKDTEEREALMKVPVTDPIRRIISDIGNPDKTPNSYVFTIIPNGLASTVKRRTDRPKSQAERIDEIVKQKIKMINERLKTICEREDVALPAITTYWARHTFANLQLEGGADLEEIRDLLGHSDVRVTENYVKRFDEERIRKAHERIDDLLKVS